MVGGSFQGARRRQEEKGFVSRTDELPKFRDNLRLRADDPKRHLIFCVHGDGGEGKTALLRRMCGIAQDDFDAATAWVDETVPDPGGPAGTSDIAARAAIGIALRALHAVPVVGGATELIDPATVEQLSSVVTQNSRRKKDAQILLFPLDVLTPALVHDIAGVGRRRPVALFFDSYEKTGPFLYGWMRSMLDGRYGDLPQDLVITIAGDALARNQPEDPGQDGLFTWLKTLPFVSHKDGQCVYRDMIRTAMIRLERRRAPVPWRRHHRALAQAFRTWRKQLSEEDSWVDSSWREYKLEETYHLLCATEETASSALRARGQNLDLPDTGDESQC